MAASWAKTGAPSHRQATFGPGHRTVGRRDVQLPPRVKHMALCPRPARCVLRPSTAMHPVPAVPPRCFRRMRVVHGGGLSMGGRTGISLAKIFRESSRFVIHGQARAERRARPEDPCLTVHHTRYGAGRGAVCAASCGHDVQAWILWSTPRCARLRHRMTKRTGRSSSSPRERGEEGSLTPPCLPSPRSASSGSSAGRSRR